MIRKSRIILTTLHYISLQIRILNLLDKFSFKLDHVGAPGLHSQTEEVQVRESRPPLPRGENPPPLSEGDAWPVQVLYHYFIVLILDIFRMGKFAPVYLTAVLEYLTAEVLEQAGLISKLLKLDRVTPQSIRLAIREDKGEIVFQSTILLFRIRI